MRTENIKTDTNNKSCDIHCNYVIGQLSIVLIVVYSILIKQYVQLYIGNMDCDCMIVSKYECHKTYNFNINFSNMFRDDLD